MSLPDWGLYSIVLLAAAAHAGWNVIVKTSADQLLSLSGLRLVGLPIAFVLLLVVPAPQKEAVPYLIGNVCFMYAYYFFLLNSYRVGEFGSVYPIARGIAPVVVLIVASILSVDEIAARAIVATVLISLGILLLSHQKHIDLRSVLFAVGTGICIAGYSFLAGVGVRQSGSVLGYLAWSEALTALGLIPAAIVMRRGRIAAYFVVNYAQIFFAGVLALSGFGITLWAFNYLPLGPVTAVRETSIVFAMAFGVLFLGERFGFAKALALITIVSGVVILSLT